MEPQAQLGRLPRALAKGLRLEPALSEVGEDDLAGIGVDLCAANHVGGNRGKEPLGVLFPAEAPGVQVAVGVEVPRLPAGMDVMGAPALIVPRTGVARSCRAHSWNLLGALPHTVATWRPSRRTAS